MISATDILEDVKKLLNYQYDDSVETNERLNILINGGINYLKNAGVSTPITLAETSEHYKICIAQYVIMVDESDVDVTQIERRLNMNISSIRW